MMQWKYNLPHMQVAQEEAIEVIQDNASRQDEIYKRLWEWISISKIA